MDCRPALLDDDVTELGGPRLTTPVRTTSDLPRTRWRPCALASADAEAAAGPVRPVDADRRELIGAVGFRIVVAGREQVLGFDGSSEHDVVALLGMTPSARWWWVTRHRATVTPAGRERLVGGRQ